MKKWMIYGANGYSGALIAKQAKAQGLTPVLAGRNGQAIEKLASTLDCENRVFALDESDTVVNELKHIDVVINCAGPFSQTAKKMMNACLKSQTHYLDITGEIAVFELANSLHEKAKQAQVILCPGVGFDVIPTDCMASRLKELMPDATHLALGFDSKSGFSPGTAKTSVEGMAQGGKVRKHGEITTVPLAYKTRKIDFGKGEKLAMTIPWGDVSTAYFTTGIENIEVYIPASPGLVKKVKRANMIRPLLGLGFVQNFLKKRIGQKVKGPSDQQRAELKTHIWGEVSNEKGEQKTLRWVTDNGYTLTVSGSLKVLEHTLDSQQSGYFTPSMLVGNQLIETINTQKN